ncbi:hypothetical protein K0M31_014048, partial [Melipona bicolor]
LKNRKRRSPDDILNELNSTNSYETAENNNTANTQLSARCNCASSCLKRKKKRKEQLPIRRSTTHTRHMHGFIEKHMRNI